MKKFSFWPTQISFGNSFPNLLMPKNNNIAILRTTLTTWLAVKNEWKHQMQSSCSWSCLNFRHDDMSSTLEVTRETAWMEFDKNVSKLSNVKCNISYYPQKDDLAIYKRWRYCISTTEMQVCSAKLGACTIGIQIRLNVMKIYLACINFEIKAK